MEKVKEKYEVLLGFVTLVISVSAFKEELSSVILPLGYFDLSAKQYFLSIVIGFGFCLYWFILEKVLRDTKVGTWTVWNYIIKISYFLFATILITPILLTINIVMFKGLGVLKGIDENTKKVILLVLNYTSTIATFGAAIMATRYYLLRNKYQNLVKAKTEEIMDLENAQRLFDQGFFSHSVLELFKVLENHLYNKLIEKGIRVQKHKFNDILKLALENKIMNREDLPWINNLREMRNVAAHSDIKYTQEQAGQTLQFVREYLRNANELAI